MMQANELRIGNWVAYRESFKKVYQIHKSGCDFQLGNTTHFQSYVWDAIEPIELTEEILLKCGFIKDAETSYRWFLGEYFAYDLDDGGFKFEGIWINPLIKHLHQLQNLYFALTGTELEINL